MDPTARGLQLTQEYLGGYTRFSAGTGSHARLVVEWNESSRHLRVLRCEPWPGAEATISATVALVRNEARSKGIIEIVDRSLVEACSEPTRPCRRTVLSSAHATAAPAALARRA